MLGAWRPQRLVPQGGTPGERASRPVARGPARVVEAQSTALPASHRRASSPTSPSRKELPEARPSHHGCQLRHPGPGARSDSPRREALRAAAPLGRWRWGRRRTQSPSPQPSPQASVGPALPRRPRARSTRRPGPRIVAASFGATVAATVGAWRTSTVALPVASHEARSLPCSQRCSSTKRWSHHWGAGAKPLDVLPLPRVSTASRASSSKHRPRPRQARGAERGWDRRGRRDARGVGGSGPLPAGRADAAARPAARERIDGAIAGEPTRTHSRKA